MEDLSSNIEEETDSDVDKILIQDTAKECSDGSRKASKKASGGTEEPSGVHSIKSHEILSYLIYLKNLTSDRGH